MTIQKEQKEQKEKKITTIKTPSKKVTIPKKYGTPGFDERMREWGKSLVFDSKYSSTVNDLADWWQLFNDCTTPLPENIDYYIASRGIRNVLIYYFGEIGTISRNRFYKEVGSRPVSLKGIYLSEDARIQLKAYQATKVEEEEPLDFLDLGIQKEHFELEPPTLEILSGEFQP